MQTSLLGIAHGRESGVVAHIAVRRKRAALRSPVLEYRTPGSVRGSSETGGPTSISNNHSYLKKRESDELNRSCSSGCAVLCLADMTSAIVGKIDAQFAVAADKGNVEEGIVESMDACYLMKERCAQQACGQSIGRYKPQGVIAVFRCALDRSKFCFVYKVLIHELSDIGAVRHAMEETEDRVRRLARDPQCGGCCSEPKVRS